jgi:hypothetical protein
VKAAAAVALLAGAALGGPAGATALEPLPAVVHAHSDQSTGDLSLDALAAAAAERGIGALLLAENYLLRVEYGLPPFRALTRVTWEHRSVVRLGVEAYLARVEAVRRRHPGLVLVPGVEVMPHYFWTGSPLDGALTLHNTQKNLLVFGLEDPRELGRLPAVGHRAAARRYGWQSVWDLLPGLLAIPGLGLLARRPRAGSGGPWRRPSRPWLLGSGVLALGILGLVRGWPFTVDPYPPWADFGIAPYQALIDHVERRGGLTVWSFPEAPDAGEERIGPVRVTWRTEPHPDDLLRSARYTAFGGLYEQPTRVVEPGGVWDRLLGEAARGERSRPAWALGEAGFHGSRDGQRLGTVQTVFLVEARTAAGVLEALRQGRLYARARTEQASLELGEFSVHVAERRAGPGERLSVPAGAPVEVRVAVESRPAVPMPLRVSLVRNGTVLEAWVGSTPFRALYRERAPAGPTVLRLDVRGPAPHRLLTSPVLLLAR